MTAAGPLKEPPYSPLKTQGKNEDLSYPAVIGGTVPCPIITQIAAIALNESSPRILFIITKST
jgi:hypothetical protein